MPEFETPTAPAEPSAGAPPSATPPTGAPTSPSAPNPTAAGNPPAPAPTAPNAPRQFTYAEDRSNWVPSSRLRETTTRAQQLERELYIERQRVAALSGVAAPAAPVDPEVQTIRQQFERIYPGLAKLEAMADKLAGLRDFDPSTVQQTQERAYEVLGAQTLARVHEHATKLFGGELKPLAKQSLDMTFGAWIYNNPDLHARYEAQDPQLVKEFFQQYQEGILDPFRRQTTTAQAPRDNVIRRLPRAGSGAPQVPGQRTLQPTDSEEYHGAAFRALQQ